VGRLGEKWRQLVGKVREWYVVSRHLQGCSVLLCRLRTDELASVRKYWTYRSHVGVYGPSEPSNLPSIERGFTPTASMAGSGEKLSTNPHIGRSSCCGLCREPFFLGAVALSIAVDDGTKVCYMWTTWDTYGLGPYVDWAWKSCGVLVGFSPAGYTSIWIAATLGYE
jgi:hypothetical protein